MTYVITGRMWGYAGEVDSWLGAIERGIANSPAAAAGQVTFERVRTIELGTRGFFTKRRIIKVEYRATCESLAQRVLLDASLRVAARSLS